MLFSIAVALLQPVPPAPLVDSFSILSESVEGTSSRRAETSFSASYLRVSDFRVASAAYRLARAAAPLCTEKVPLTGLLLHHLPEYEPAVRPRLVASYSLDQGPGVLAVVDASAAMKAGIQAGDVLLTMNGRNFPSPRLLVAEPDAKKWRLMIRSIELDLEEQLRLGPVKLELLRDGSRQAVTLSSAPGCPGRVRLARSKQVNAFADGHSIIMTTAMLDFMKNDDELYVALAHELAHNILQHPAKLEQQKVPSGFMRGFGRNASRVRATEAEADRLAIRLLDSAGLKVSAALPFWRRLQTKHGSALNLFRTHPSAAAREQIINDVLAEIAHERATGQSLMRQP